ncbi:P-loop containing nucleoside triphosphate hydrolase protein, partial [Obelidium mucronatum]
GRSLFRENQLEVIKKVLEGRNVLAKLPTGSEKSLLFQVPGVLLEHTVVVSPLNALSHDQVKYLLLKGVSAAYWESKHKDLETVDIPKAVACSTTKILFFSPEKLCSFQFSSTLSKARIDLLVIDEAHLIDVWGNSFRPKYLQMQTIAAQLKPRSILCLTATATPSTSKALMDSFDIPACQIFQTSMNRSNLILRCTQTRAASKFADIYNAISNNLKLKSTFVGNGIVYCLFRKECEELATFLAMRSESRFKCRYYHAGLTDNERSNVELWFLGSGASTLKVIVATVAFGLGINKPDICYVIHATISQSPERYYQEIGRAGRDG